MVWLTAAHAATEAPFLSHGPTRTTFAAWAGSSCPATGQQPATHLPVCAGPGCVLGWLGRQCAHASGDHSCLCVAERQLPLAHHSGHGGGFVLDGAGVGAERCALLQSPPCPQRNAVGRALSLVGAGG